MAHEQQKSTRPTMENKNVAGGPLALFSKSPPTGYFRDGYCRFSSEDPGNHSVAAIVNDEFLDFSASKGNNLKDVGVKSGTKWCLCAGRWKEAFDAAQKGDLSKDAVPKVFLHASDENALKTVSYSDLKKYAAEPEASKSQTQSRQSSHINPSGREGSAVKHV